MQTPIKGYPQKLPAKYEHAEAQGSFVGKALNNGEKEYFTAAVYWIIIAVLCRDNGGGSCSGRPW